MSLMRSRRSRTLGWRGKPITLATVLWNTLQLALIFYQQDYRTVNFLRRFMRLKGLGFEVFLWFWFLLERGSVIFLLFRIFRTLGLDYF